MPLGIISWHQACWAQLAANLQKTSAHQSGDAVRRFHSSSRSRCKRSPAAKMALSGFGGFFALVKQGPNKSNMVSSVFNPLYRSQFCGPGKLLASLALREQFHPPFKSARDGRPNGPPLRKQRLNRDKRKIFTFGTLSVFRLHLNNSHKSRDTGVKHDETWGKEISECPLSCPLTRELFLRGGFPSGLLISCPRDRCGRLPRGKPPAKPLPIISFQPCRLARHLHRALGFPP